MWEMVHSQHLQQDRSNTQGSTRLTENLNRITLKQHRCYIAIIRNYFMHQASRKKEMLSSSSLIKISISSSVLYMYGDARADALMPR